MSMTDPVADMLTRIRNACSAGHRRVDVPASKVKVELALARGKQAHDKRQDMARRDAQREVARELGRRAKGKT